MGGEIVSDIPALFKAFSIPCAWGRSRFTVAQAFFRYSWSVLSEATVVGCGTSFSSFAGTTLAVLPSEALVFEENFLNSFDIGI